MNRAPDITAVRATASQWLARRDAGLSPAEEAELQAWCTADPVHAEAFARYERLWERMDGPRQTNTGAHFTRELSQMGSRRRRARRSATALCLLIGLGLGIGMMARRHAPEAIGDTTSMGVIVPKQQVLPDGSVVEFPASAAFSVDFSSPAVRRVTLDRGEAHFAVAKNPERPFVVRAGGVDVQAVGTAFAVQLGGSAVDVIVTEGRVAVDRAAATLPGTAAPEQTTTARYVGAGEKLSVTTAGGNGVETDRQAAEAISAAELEQRLAWRNPRMEFSNTPLPEVIAAINRYGAAHGGSNFKLADASLEAVRLSGIFRVDDTRSFMGILETGFAIKAERVASEVYELRRAP
jgi:transmembrane sensor